MKKLPDTPDTKEFLTQLPSATKLQNMMEFIEEPICENMTRESVTSAMRVWVQEGSGIERCYLPTRKGFVYLYRYFVGTPETGEAI